MTTMEEEGKEEEKATTIVTTTQCGSCPSTGRGLREQRARDAIRQAASRASVGSSSDVAQNDDSVIGGNQLYVLGFIVRFSTSSDGRRQHRQRSVIRTCHRRVLGNWMYPKIIGSWHLANECSRRHLQKRAENCNLTDAPRHAWCLKFSKQAKRGFARSEMVCTNFYWYQILAAIKSKKGRNAPRATDLP